MKDEEIGEFNYNPLPDEIAEEVIEDIYVY